MMRSNSASSLQKAYDESYLMCSTAVYFEGQNNEEEALRSWRSALENIYYANAHRVPSSKFAPKSETEKALQESLRQLEIQCRERVDLLEALRESRKEARERSHSNGSSGGGGGGGGVSGAAAFLLHKGKTSPRSSDPATPGWIGDGTIPAVGYTDLSKPVTFPGRRPSPPTTRASHESASNEDANAAGAGTPATSSPAFRVKSNSSRNSSPERRKPMLTTLRNSDSKKASKKKDSPSRKDMRPAASKAAGMAWGNIYRSPSLSDRTPTEAAAVASSKYSASASNDTVARKEKSNSGDERPSKRNGRVEDVDDRIPGRNWREPRVSTPTRQGFTNSSTPGPSFAYMSPPPKDVPQPSASPKPSIKPKPAGLRSSPQAYPLDSKPSPKSRSRTRASATPKPYASQGGGGDGLNHAMNRVAVSAEGPVRRKPPQRPAARVTPPSSDPDSLGPKSTDEEEDKAGNEEDAIMDVMNRLPKGVDTTAARQILNDIVVRGDEVHWEDIAGLEGAKKALKEAVVYPFLRPDLFLGLREPARGMLLFGPPGTGKTMLARAVATESKSTFFSVSASTLTSKWHGESEKLVRALFGLAKALAPSIIFVDEIDSLLTSRSTSSENEASRRSKTEFLIQWSDLQRAAAGREQSPKDKKLGDASRVLVLAATNMPWDIDEAARRRFVRRQYVPLPEHDIREQQLRKLLSHQIHELNDADIKVLVDLTDGFSGSDITALAKDAAMGPLRNLGEALLHTPMDQIRAIQFPDFEASLTSIRPSVSPGGLREYEDWARNFGERA